MPHPEKILKRVLLKKLYRKPFLATLLDFNNEALHLFIITLFLVFNLAIKNGIKSIADNTKACLLNSFGYVVTIFYFPRIGQTMTKKLQAKPNSYTIY